MTNIYIYVRTVACREHSVAAAVFKMWAATPNAALVRFAALLQYLLRLSAHTIPDQYVIYTDAPVCMSEPVEMMFETIR